MQFTDAPLQPIGEVLLDMPIESNLGYKTPLVYRILKLLCGEGYLPPYGYQMCEVALEEAISNAMIHGNQLDPEKQIHVVVSGDGDTFSIMVEDAGSGFAADDVPDPDDPETLLLEHGRGIMLMNHYMDEVRYNAAGTGLLMTRGKQTEPDPGAKPPSKPMQVVEIPDDGTIEAEEIEVTVVDDEDVEQPEVVIPDEIELDLDTDDAPQPAAAMPVPMATQPQGPVSIGEQGGVVIGAVHAARITEDNAAEVRVALTEGVGKASKVGLDLGAVSFMSSTGIATLMAVYKQVRANKGSLVLFNVQPAIANILEATGLTRLFQFAADQAEAINKLQSS
jgi:serine/threonine-protein kinase RsbW